MKLFPLVGCLVFLGSSGMAQSSADELVAQVLKALESNDRQALRDLRIAEGETKKFVWPSVAAQMAGNGMNADRFISMYEKSNEVGVVEVLEQFGGRKWVLVKVAIDAPKKQTKAYRLFPAPLVTVRDESGQEKTVRLIGGILEHEGTFKVATYYVSPAQRKGI